MQRLCHRQVVRSRMEPHAAFMHCAEPCGFLNCPWLFFVLSVVQSLCKTVIQQPEVRWVGWAGMRSRYSGTSLQLHLAPLGLLTLFDIMRAAGEMPMRLLHVYYLLSPTWPHYPPGQSGIITESVLFSPRTTIGGWIGC
jgi:hypothetical protein